MRCKASKYILYVLFSISLFSSCSYDDTIAIKLAEEIIYPSGNEKLLMENPSTVKQLIINGFYLPEKFPAYLDSTEITTSFYHAWKAKKLGDSEAARSYLIAIKDDNEFHSITTNALSQSISETIEPEGLYFLRNKKFNSMSFLDKLTYLNLIISSGVSFATDYHFQNALSTIFYGLHLIEVDENKGLLIKQENELLLLYANLCMNETEKYSATIPSTIKRLKSNYSILHQIDMHTYLDMLFMDEGILDNEAIFQLNLSDLHKEKLLTHKGFLEFDKNPQKAIDLFNIAQGYTQESSYRGKILHIYKAYNYLDMEAYKLVNNELKQVQAKSNISSATKNNLEFHVKTIELEVLAKKNQCEAILSKTLELRAVAKKAFTGHKSLHLEDYYSKSIVELLKLIEDCDINIREYQHEFMSLFHESKILTEHNLIGINFTEHLTINKDLLKVRDFTAMELLHDPVFVKLFHESIAEFISTEDSPIDYTPISDALFNTDSIILSFVAYGDNYGVYIKETDNFTLQLIDRQRVDSLLKQMVVLIQHDDTMTKPIANLQSELDFIHSLPNNQHIHIIPDGFLGLFPFEVIFPNKQFIYLNSIDRLLDEEISIEKENGTIFSFSDSLTIIDKSVRKIPELPEAYLESQSINKTTQARLLSGKQLTKTTFTESLGSNYIHVATHGKSSTVNRLENYIILRDNIELDTLYAFELSAIDQFPEVAILSSCSTGTGSFMIGSGTFSVANGLHKSGTNNIVKTLWPIKDRASREFMIDFYDYWMAGESLQQALYKTKNDYRKKGYPTQDWAGFVLSGLGNVYLN